VYAPGASDAVLNVVPCAAPLGSVQLPPAAGAPPSALIRLKGAAVLQSDWLPLVPALAAGDMETETVAEAAGHGPFAGSEYV
jgi:hypothetical protein